MSKPKFQKIFLKLGLLILRSLTEYNHKYNPAGDIEEEYKLIRESRGHIRAGFWYWEQILVAILQHISLTFYWRLAMLWNYLKIAVRNLKKQKGYSIINISGLAIGMACCMLILLWVQDELSYDRFHENLDNIYRVVCKRQNENNIYLFAVTPAPIAAAIKRDFPEIEKATMLGFQGGFTVKCGNEVFRESRYRFVDTDFFEIFSFRFVQGGPETVFSNPYSVVLSEEMVDKYFSNQDPIGKTLTIDGQFDVTVTGVIQNKPKNSTLHYNFLSPFQILMKEHAEPGDEEDWNQHAHSTFVKLSPNTSIQTINEKICNYKKDIIDPESDITYFLQPFDRIHLHSSHISDGFSGKGNIQYIYLFSVLAILILMIACINFINLMTARSTGRAKEVGLRKVVGAFRSNIIRQFYGETVFLALLAFLLAILLVYMALPEFNSIARKELSFAVMGNLKILAGMAGIVILTGIVSGSYPAVYISAFQPVTILKGSNRSSSKGFWLRKILVVSQFTLSIILIIAATVLSKQLHYIRNKDLGYNRNQLISIPMPASIIDRFEIIKAEVQRIPDIVNVAGSSSPIPWKQTRIAGLEWEGCDPDNDVRFNIDFIDDDYINTLEIEMIDGEHFSKEKSREGTSFILNEEAVRQMGLEDPIGKRFDFFESGQIVGILKDFIFDSFQNPIEPLLFVYAPSELRYIHIKMQPFNISESIDVIEQTWKRINPNVPFRYDFVDDDFNILSLTEQRIGTIFRWSAILGILISCLGLIGLASYVAVQRTKEVGIRKVLGASGVEIFIMMIREFLKWTLLANLIAWPIAWFVINEWIKNYAYRIDIGWMIFASSGTIALFMAILTVGYQAVRAALANPVNSLQYE